MEYLKFEDHICYYLLYRTVFSMQYLIDLWWQQMHDDATSVSSNHHRTHFLLVFHALHSGKI
jgi:hypothetical protein